MWAHVYMWGLCVRTSATHMFVGNCKLPVVLKWKNLVSMVDHK